MDRENKLLIVILAILAVGVLVTGTLIAYLATTRQQEDVDLTEPEEDLALLLTPTEPVAESYIAYVTDRSDDDDQTAIYVLEVGGGEQGYLNSRYIAGSEDGIYVLPSWSPDGQKIAYSVQVPEDGASEDDYWMEEEGLVLPKGGTYNLILHHPNPINAAVRLAKDNRWKLFGEPLKERLRRYFHEELFIEFEVFGESLP